IFLAPRIDGVLPSFNNPTSACGDAQLLPVGSGMPQAICLAVDLVNERHPAVVYKGPIVLDPDLVTAGIYPIDYRRWMSDGPSPNYTGPECAFRLHADLNQDGFDDWIC